MVKIVASPRLLKSLKHTYSDTITHKRVAVLGNYPPPLGGVSVHIARAMHKFVQQHNTVFHFDTSKRNSKLWYVCKLLIFLFTKRCDIVYYHTVDLNRRLFELSLLLHMKKRMGYQLVLVEHNCRYLYAKSMAYKKAFNKCLQSIDALVLIGYSTWYSYLENNIIVPRCTTVESAFLPPDMATESAIIATYPATLAHFMAKHKLLVIVNAFQLSIIDGRDLYGIDLCVKALATLVHQYPTIGLLCVLAQQGDQKHFKQLQQEVKVHGLEQHVYFLIGQKELWPLLKRADLFVRPTLSDGESVSVQEALYFNIPVVASDASPRPAEVITFRSRDVMDFCCKISAVLQPIVMAHKQPLTNKTMSGY